MSEAELSPRFFFTNRRGVSNIRPAGHNPARQAFLSGPLGLPEMSKICVYRMCFFKL